MNDVWGTSFGRCSSKSHLFIVLLDKGKRQGGAGNNPVHI